MFAIISHKGKQYKVEKDKSYNFDLIEEEPGKEVVFDKVILFTDDKNVTVGTPAIKAAAVTGEIIEHIKDDKVIAFKFKAKKHYKRTQGHRQQYSVVRIKDIKI